MRWAICILSGVVVIVPVISSLALLTATQAQDTLTAVPPIKDNGTWQTYTTTHGLPSNDVIGGIVLNDEGTLWAGFTTGKWWYPLPSNLLMSHFQDGMWISNELPGCSVQSLAASHYIYAGTYCSGPPSNAGGGLSALIEGTWVTFTPIDGMSGTYIRAIAPEGDTKVWAAAGDTLFGYNFIHLLDHKGTITKSDDEWTIDDWGLPSAYAIAIDPAGNRWFGTSEGVRVLLADDATWITYSSDLVNFATDIAFDATGNTWFVGYTEVTRFDGTNWTYYDSREAAIEANYDAIMTSFDRNHVHSGGVSGLWAIEGQTGVWIINQYTYQGGGVAFYNGTTWTTYTHENSALGSNRVSGIAIDGQGEIWFSTLSTYPGGDGGITHFTPNRTPHKLYLPIASTQ